MRLIIGFAFFLISPFAFSETFYQYEKPACYPTKQEACSKAGGQYGKPENTNFDTCFKYYNYPASNNYEPKGDPLPIYLKNPGSGYHFDAPSCSYQPDNDCVEKKGQEVFGSYAVPYQGNPPTFTCKGSCELRLGAGELLHKVDKSGSTFFGSYVYTGAACTVGPENSNPPPTVPNDSVTTPAPNGPSDCGPGEVYGQVNGKPVCVNNNYDPPPGSTPGTGTGENSDDTGENPPNPTASGADATASGSNGTGTGTGTGDGTGTDGEGDGTGEEGEEEADDFCKKNPNLSICKEGKFTGTCGTGFSCTGDAVQCAQAKYTAQQNCLLDPNKVVGDSESMLSKGDALKSDGTGKYAGEGGALSGRIIESSVSMFNFTTDSSSCPPPVTFTVFGKTASISYEGLCTLVLLLRPLVIGVSLIMGFFVLKAGI